MALIYATPLYIFQAVPDVSPLIIFPVVMLPILIAWTLNLLILIFIKAKWANSFIRIFVVGSVMFVVSGFAVQFLHPLNKVSDSFILLMRIVNILSVNTIIYILIDLVLTKENKNKIELEYTNMKLKKLEADYKLLKDQINPHFLFNALSTAKALVKPNPELAEMYIIRLSDFLRASINNNKKTNSLKEELQMCNDYIELNKIRFGDAIHFDCNLSLDKEKNYVPYFSILSLIENAIKHNSFTLENPLNITITNNDDIIKVVNNVRKKFVMEPTTKSGLNNLSERYKLLSGKEIRIYETEEFFSVKLPALQL